MTSSITTTGTKTGRARRTFGQLWQIPLFFIGLSALLAVAASAPWRLTPQEAEFRRYLIALRQDLNNDSAEVDSLANQAENLLLRAGEFPRRAAEAHFLAGSAYHLQAERKSAALAQELWSRAVQNLEKAEALGVADADLPMLQYRLGYSLYRQNKDHTRAIDLMTMAVEKGSRHPAEGYRILIDANLAGPKANLDGAIAASRRLLDLIPESQADALAPARVQYAELLLRKERRVEAIRELEQIGPKTPTALRIKARLLQAQACEAERAWRDAIPIWNELLKDASHVPGGGALIYYRLGWCYHEMTPANYEENIRVWKEAVKLGDAAGQAAAIHLGELRLAQGGEQAGLALSDWAHAFKNVRSAEDFKNPFVDIAQVRVLFRHAIDTFNEQRDAEKTQAVAELFRKITPGGAAELLSAQSAEAYARLLDDKLKANVPGVAESEVFAQYRRAGQAFENVSLAGEAKDRPEALWRGIQCYLAARDGPRAQQVLMQYVQIESNEERLAEAWYTIGNLYHVGNQKAKAYDAFVQCIAYPDNIFKARAEYQIAEVEIEKSKYENAQEILTKIITGTNNQTDAQTREKAHFRLASLLLSLNQFAKAQVYLKACVTLYPANPNHYVVREQLGECCRQLAKAELAQEKALQQKIQSAAALDRQQLIDRLSNHRQKRKNLLKEADQSYFQLAIALEHQAEQKPLTGLEQTLLRRAWFGMGDCHLDNEDYSKALPLFQDVQKKNRRSLESLYACSRIVDTIDAMMHTAVDPGKLKEQALESVKIFLADMADLPAEHEMFRMPRVPSRATWMQWATTTQAKLTAPAKKEGPLPAIR